MKTTHTNFKSKQTRIKKKKNKDKGGEEKKVCVWRGRGSKEDTRW